jgi:signal peptide peptidase SppA
MSDRYAHILSVVFSHPWAIEGEMLSTIAEILAARIAGDEPNRAAIEAALINRDRLPQATSGGGVAVIPVHGVIMPRGDALAESSGSTSLDSLSAQLRAALADSDVNTIVLDVDSPGGNVAGLTEFTHEILAARAQKPIIASARYTMASAAYGLASAATQIVASPSATLGGIGVLNIHNDLSKALEQRGIKRTYIAAGKYKAEGNEAEPLSAEAGEARKATAEEAYGTLTADIARGRGVPVDTVRNGYGEGRTVSAKKALALGMIDKIETIHDTLARVKTAAPAAGGRAALVPVPSLDATDQEPLAATSQERQAEVAWQHAQTRALFELESLEGPRPC